MKMIKTWAIETEAGLEVFTDFKECVDKYIGTLKKQNLSDIDMERAIAELYELDEDNIEYLSELTVNLWNK